MSAYRGPSQPELGALVEDARPNRGPLIALSVLFLFIALIIDVSAFATPPTTTERWLTIVLFGVLAPVLALVALFGRKPDALRVHELGFVSGTHAVRFDDVVEMRTQRYVAGNRRQMRSTLDRYTFKTKSGETFELRLAFPNNDAVLGLLQERMRPHLIASTSLPAKFGPVTVDDAGVRTEFASLKWSEIERASFDGPASQVVIRGPGSAWIELPLHEVPNAHVLTALVNQRVTAGAAR
jgi:hypothetical protein